MENIESPRSARRPAAELERSWAEARGLLSGLPAGGVNMAHEAVDRHGVGLAGDRIALRWIDRSGAVRDYTYRELMEQTSRFANLLGALGVARGERVFALCGRRPELYVAALGALKLGAVFCPLFPVFGPEPIRTRLALGAARVLVTTAALYAAKVRALRPHLPALRHVLLVDDGGSAEEAAGAQCLEPLLARASPCYRIPPTDPGDHALLHFTSGTTGDPKGVLLGHGAVVAHHASARLALDLRQTDVYWCTAEPGWVTGTCYGIVAPLTVGATVVVDDGEFSPERWYGILREHRVGVWYTSPTAIRILMKYGDELARRCGPRALRFIASVGEALNPGAVRWGEQVLGCPIHDTWWQTETGSIMIANTPTLPIRPGSMGRPLPGIEAAVVRREQGGRIAPVGQPGEPGELALRAGWPSMFRGYLDDPGRYAACFADGWYLSGDIVWRDSDGYYWFVGRGDDLIKSSGHLVGPVEVERVLLEHPQVAEAAVIGRPDPVATEVIVAVVELKDGSLGGEALRRELLAHARRRLGPALAPRAIEFSRQLPRTQSGKILRRLLRARERQPPPGDSPASAPPA